MRHFSKFNLICAAVFFATLSALSAFAQDRLAKPNEISLSGNIRREIVSSPVGSIELRWPRKVETLFGRSPLRATVDAAATLSRAIRRSGFPTRAQNFNRKWQVVFLDQDLPEAEIPQKLISDCHPGWMTPPANIYIVGQRVAAGCGSERRTSASVADSELARVLIHEFGHALEFELTQGTAMHERFRAEGFATWFEVLAAEHSSFLNKTALYSYQQRLAQASVTAAPQNFSFSGSAQDYARAAFFFHTLQDRFGLASLMDVYDEMADSRAEFFPAVNKRLGWSAGQLNAESLRLIQK